MFWLFIAVGWDARKRETDLGSGVVFGTMYSRNESQSEYVKGFPSSPVSGLSFTDDREHAQNVMENLLHFSQVKN